MLSKKIILGIGTFAVFTITFFLTSFVFAAQQQWKTSLVQRGGFQISFPANWEEITIPPDSPDPFMAVVFLSPFDSPEDHFREQVGISIEYRAYPSLKSFFDTVSREIQNAPGVILTSSGTSTIDGQPAYWLTYLWDKEGEKIEGLVYLLYGKSTFFRIICLSESKRFKEYQPLFQSIAQSLTLNPQLENSNPSLSQSQ